MPWSCENRQNDTPLVGRQFPQVVCAAENTYIERGSWAEPSVLTTQRRDGCNREPDRLVCIEHLPAFPTLNLSRACRHDSRGFITIPVSNPLARKQNWPSWIPPSGQSTSFTCRVLQPNHVGNKLPVSIYLYSKLDNFTSVNLEASRKNRIDK